MRVHIDSRYPINMTVSAEDFGKHFAAARADEQVAILQAIVEEMKSHPIQWDYIALEIESSGNTDILRGLRQIFHTLFVEGRA